MVFIASNFLSALADILNFALNAYMIVIVFRAVLSWVSPDPRNILVQFLVASTEPILAPLRRLLPTWRWGIDFSPWLAVLGIVFIQKFLVASLTDLAGRMHDTGHSLILCGARRQPAALMKRSTILEMIADWSVRREK